MWDNMWDNGIGKYLYGMTMILCAAGFLFVASRMHGVVEWIAWIGFLGCTVFVFWLIAYHTREPSGRH